MTKGIVKGFIAIAVAMVVFASPASAQIKWGLGIGPTVPTGTFADGFKTGIHAVFIANYDLTAKPISFRADAVYNVNKCDVSGCGDLRSKLLTFSGNVAYNFPTTRTHPYLTGGLTWANASCSNCGGASSENDIGLNVGGGLHFDVGPTKAFIEARYFAIGGNVDAHFVPISFGIRF